MKAKKRIAEKARDGWRIYFDAGLLAGFVAGVYAGYNAGVYAGILGLVARRAELPVSNDLRRFGLILGHSGKLDGLCNPM